MHIKKKSQITIFVLLGLALLIGVGFIVYIRNSATKTADAEKISNLPFDFVPVKNYVESCIENIGKDGILLIGMHGGYFILPEYNTRDRITKTAYYFYMDKNLMPFKSRIEQELSEYMDEELYFCIKNFADFKEQGLEIESGEINTKTVIGPNNVKFKVDYPLTAKKGASQIKLDSFTKSINNVRLGVIYNVSAETINEQMKDFDSICLSCIINFAIEKDLLVDLQKLDNTTILFTITDNNTRIDGFPYKFIFANKYREVSCRNIPSDWPEEKLQEFLLECVQSEIKKYNYELSINEIPDLAATANVPFTYNVKAAGINVNFTDYTNLFDINKTSGLISFIPAEDNIGEQVIWINAVDSLGNEDFESFKLDIRKPS